MIKRLQLLGIGLVVMGLVFFAAGGYTLYKTQQGAASLQAFSAAQNVKLTYNDQGQLVDRGDVAESAAIMSLLTKDWGYTTNPADFDPNDPTINTASEYMYQMATVSYHTLTSTVTRPARTTSRSTASTTQTSIAPTRSRRRHARSPGRHWLCP